MFRFVMLAADSSGIADGLNSFFDNWIGVIIQLVATVLLAVIIRVFFWKPISRFLESKQKAVTEDVEEAKLNNELALENRKKSEAYYEATKKEINELREKLTKEAYDEKSRIIDEAKVEAKRRLDQLEIDLENEVLESQEEIKKAIKEIAILAAEKIVSHEIDESTHDQTIKKVIEENLN